MGFKKIIAGISLPLFLSSFLISQNLAEIAKKEKERKQKLKGKKAKVVTNADLKKLKRMPAVIVVRSGAVPEVSPTTEEEPQEELLTEETQPSETYKSEMDELQKELEEKWQRSKEYVSLLTTRMNALWQEFYSLDDMTSRDGIQREISETFLKLQKAQQDEAQARKELNDFNAQTKKERH